ncbi:MAG: 50S ribosomal protein L29 [Candidatus Uhrbacteria bacterium]
MDIKQMREQPEEELRRKFDELRVQLEDLRFRASARELKNVHEIRSTRRAIARILTVFHERELHRDHQVSDSK